MGKPAMLSRSAVVLVLAALGAVFPGCSDEGDRGGDGIHPGKSTPLLPLAVTQTETTVVFTTPRGEVAVVMNKDPLVLRYETNQGNSVSEPSQGLFFVSSGKRVYLDRVEGVSVQGDRGIVTAGTGLGVATLEVSFLEEGVARLELTPPAAAQAFSAGERFVSPQGEALYGLIERMVTNPLQNEYIPREVGSLDRRGTIVLMIVVPTVSICAPILHSSRGYGIFVEGTAVGIYDLASSNPEVIEFAFNIPPGKSSFSYLFINGPSHDRILDRYTAITGRPFVPPEWAFLHWRWRDEHRLGPPGLLDGVQVNADLADDVLHYEALGIPVGNYTIDRPWGTNDLEGLPSPEEPGFGDLVWDEARFPNAKRMIDILDRRGYHVFLWVAPWATGKTTNREALERGYLAPDSRFIIDYTNPEAVRWWEGKIEPLIRMGIAGLKLDRGDEDTPWALEDVYWDGRSGLELRNDYPNLYLKVHHDIVSKVRGEDFLVYARTGYAGSQQWSIFDGGDIPGRDWLGRSTDLGLRSAILALLHCAFMGFPIWGSDTGGYEQFGDREVFARWIEFSAFCPIMEIGGVGTHAPWDMPTTPRYDTEMIEIYRFYTTLHHKLLPYTYAHARQAGMTGRPIAKPLVFNYQDDERVRDMWDEFLYGDDILVAPVWRIGQRSRKVYLPRGRWVDYWNTSLVITGPADLEVDVPLDRIPIFVRKGAPVLGTF
jgi:alpha-D-xyloside xylohydrolase